MGHPVFSTRLRRATITCPVCNNGGIIRDSEQVTPLVTDLNCHCSNTGCGHTWKSQISFVYTISPSAIARDDLDLPQAPANFVRHIYPPGSIPRGHAPDPDQLTIFDLIEPIAA